MKDKVHWAILGMVTVAAMIIILAQAIILMRVQEFPEQIFMFPLEQHQEQGN